MSVSILLYKRCRSGHFRIQFDCHMLLYLTPESLSSLIPICLCAIFFSNLQSSLSHIINHCIKSFCTLTQLIIKVIIWDMFPYNTHFKD